MVAVIHVFVSSSTSLRVARLTLMLAVAGAGLALGASGATSASERGLLWRVVQTCLINHKLTGASFPCLDVQTPNGRATGWATLRAPLEKTHIIVTPTIRTIGIEAGRLQVPDAPSYFHDAWGERHFVTEELRQQPGRTDLGMAVNSKMGRSQDQLHIHVNCLRDDVKRSLAHRDRDVRDPSAPSRAWTRVTIMPHAPRYFALDVSSEDLSGINVFALVADGLKIDLDDMDDMTIVVAGSDSIQDGSGHHKPGFTILARQRQQNAYDDAHGEALLDHDCKAFQ